MEEQNSVPSQGVPNNSLAPAQPISPPIQPIPPVQPVAPPVQPAQPAQPAQPQTVIIQKSSPWPWIVGGCLMLVILIIISIALAGWWGVRKVKEEVKKYEPTAESLKNNMDKLNQEAADWEKKSQEFQENLPANLENLEKIK